MRRGRRSRKDFILDTIGRRSIVLVGMMGCGKSAIGKMLAHKLELEFRDADSEIEVAADRSVAEIFEDYGESEFRRLENRVIDRLMAEGPSVLAIGGGAFINDETRQTILEKGLSVWLKTDIDTLLERVMRKPGKRPLLTKGDPREIMTDLMKIRDPVYAQSELHVQSLGGRKAEMRNHLLQSIHDYLKKQEK